MKNVGRWRGILRECYLSSVTSVLSFEWRWQWVLSYSDTIQYDRCYPFGRHFRLLPFVPLCLYLHNSLPPPPPFISPSISNLLLRYLNMIVKIGTCHWWWHWRGSDLAPNHDAFFWFVFQNYLCSLTFLTVSFYLGERTMSTECSYL